MKRKDAYSGEKLLNTPKYINIGEGITFTAVGGDR